MENKQQQQFLPTIALPPPLQHHFNQPPSPPPPVYRTPPFNPAVDPSHLNPAIPSSVPIWQTRVLDFYTLLCEQLSNKEYNNILNAPAFFQALPDNDNEFDSWFLLCAHRCRFSIEMAWSLIVRTSSRWKTYADLILHPNRVVRLQFARLSAMVRRDILIETSTWRFSNPENSSTVMTLNKKEIQIHELSKLDIMKWFGTSSSYSSSLLPKRNDNVDEQSEEKTRFNDQWVLFDLSRYATTPFNRLPDALLEMEQERVNDFEIKSFYASEMECIARMQKEEKNVTLDKIKDSLLARPLFVAAVGITYHLRNKNNRLEHIPWSMRLRLLHSRISLEKDICHIFADPASSSLPYRSPYAS